MKKISYLAFINQYIVFIPGLIILCVFLIGYDLNNFFTDYLFEFVLLCFFIIGYEICYGSMDFYNQATVSVSTDNELNIVQMLSSYTVADYDIEKVFIKKNRNMKSMSNAHKIQIILKGKRKICFLYKSFILENEKRNDKLWNVISWDKVIL